MQVTASLVLPGSATKFRAEEGRLKSVPMASGRFVVAIVRRCAHGTRSSFLAAQNGLQPTSLVLTSEHFKKNNTVGLRVQPRSVRYQSVALVTRCPPGPVKGYSVSSHVTLLQPSRTHSTDPEELGRLKRGWMKIARLIKAFMDGTKALYKDVRLMYELRKRSGSLVISRHAPRESASGKVEFPFTWDEVQFMYRVRMQITTATVHGSTTVFTKQIFSECTKLHRLATFRSRRIRFMQTLL